MAEDDLDNVDFEEGFAWIPAHVLQDCDDDDHLEEQSGNHRHQNLYRNDLKLPAAERTVPLSKSSSKPPPHQRSRQWGGGGGTGGPGMQAIFLDSGQKSCGTGVFLPRRAGTTDFQFTNKPACSPVLLPARVVQALKLNVHELGLQITPPDVGNNAKSRSSKTGGNGNSNNNKKGSEVTSKTCVISQNHHRSASPDIFLPKEWTY